MPEIRVIKTREMDMPVEGLIVKVKKLNPEAVLPQQAQQSDAGYDLVAIDDGEIKWAESPTGENTGLIQYIQYRCGFSVEPPEGYHLEIFPRSSITKYDLMLANSIGLVDEGFRGEILVRFKVVQPQHDLKVVRGLPIRKYQKGERIAQLVLRKTIRAKFVEAESLSDSQRSSGGFGSTGK